MADAATIKKFFSDSHRHTHAMGKAEGEALGKAKALMMILAHREIVTFTSISELCLLGLAHTDLATLDRWLRRALSSASLSEVFE
jgi:hypothetical protein